MLYMGNTFQIFQAPWYQPSEAAHEATDTLFPGPRLATIRRPYHWKRLILAAKLLPATCRGRGLRDQKFKSNLFVIQNPQ